MGQHDCAIVLGDFNSRLRRNVPGLTGKWCVHSHADEGGQHLMEIMTSHGLCAASTYFQPKSWLRRDSNSQRSYRKRWGNATYMPPQPRDPSSAPMKPRQIDYILVSKRWMSSCKHCQVHWRP